MLFTLYHLKLKQDGSVHDKTFPSCLFINGKVKIIEFCFLPPKPPKIAAESTASSAAETATSVASSMPMAAMSVTTNITHILLLL